MDRNRIAQPGRGSASGILGDSLTTPSDMFPKSAVGSVTGIGGMAGAIGGALLMVYAATPFRRSCNVVFETIADMMGMPG